MLKEATPLLSSQVGAPAGLGAWIEDLRGRLERGELAGLGPIELEDGSKFFSVELAVRIMLADLDHHEDLPRAEREHPRIEARRRGLLEDFRKLRERLR